MPKGEGTQDGDFDHSLHPLGWDFGKFSTSTLAQSFTAIVEKVELKIFPEDIKGRLTQNFIFRSKFPPQPIYKSITPLPLGWQLTGDFNPADCNQQ